MSWATSKAEAMGATGAPRFCGEGYCCDADHSGDGVIAWHYTLNGLMFAGRANSSQEAQELAAVALLENANG